jgi:hypothetical protein
MEFKAMVAKAKIFRDTQKIARSNFLAFQANVASYTVSVLSEKLGERIDLDLIWRNQDISPRLTAQITTWAREVNDVLHQTADGRMISEWAKKSECREAVLGAKYSPAAKDIPEVR